MYPWFFVWAPQFHFPWSGAVNQEISPDTFFGAIPPEAGDGKIEQEIFNTASYGKQLGILTDVVLSLLAENSGLPRSPEAQHAVAQLQATATGVAAIKAKHGKQKVDAAFSVLRELKHSDPVELRRIVTELDSVLVPAAISKDVHD